jgi:hypothetical protein
MNVKPSIGFFTKDGNPVFTDKVTTVLEWMTANPHFATPSPTLPIVQTSFDGYKAATAEAAQGGVENTAIRNARRTELVSLLRPLANYVSSTANGDLETLISSGFPVQKTANTPIGPLPAPDAPRVSQGPVTGSAKARTKPVYGALSYLWRLALASAPTVYVKTTQTSGARIGFNGLTAGQEYKAEVNAFGAAGTSDWSDAGSLMVI